MFKLTYENSENIKADCVSTAAFNLHQIKGQALFLWGGGGHLAYVGPAHEKFERKFQSSPGVETRCLSSLTAEDFQ